MYVNIQSAYMHLHMHTYMNIIYIYMLYMSIYIYMYVYTCIYVYIYVYIFLYISVYELWKNPSMCSIYVSHLQNSFPICHLEICQANNEAYCASIHIGHIAGVLWALVPHSPSSPINHVLSNSKGNGTRSRGN